MAKHSSEEGGSLLRIVHLSYAIHPGGGPPGYLYSLRDGYRQLEANYGVEMRFWAPTEDSKRKEGARRPVSKTFSYVGRRLPENLLQLLVCARLETHLRRWARLGYSALMSLAPVHCVVLHSPYFARLATILPRGVRVIYVPHSPRPWWQELTASYERRFEKSMLPRISTYAQGVEEFLFDRADFIIAPAPHSLDAYRDSWGDLWQHVESKIRYVLTGVATPAVEDNRAQIRRQLGAKVDAFVVSYAGRYHSDKGFDHVLKIAHLLRDRPDICFVTMGRGPIKPSTLPNLLDLGWQEQPHSIIAASDLLLLPNRVTYFDLVALEATALGIPVLAAATGGNIDLARLAPGVLLVDRYQPSGFAEMILKLKGERGYLARLGAANKRAYHMWFSAKAFAERYVTFLSNALHPGS